VLVDRRGAGVRNVFGGGFAPSAVAVCSFRAVFQLAVATPIHCQRTCAPPSWPTDVTHFIVCPRLGAASASSQLLPQPSSNGASRPEAFCLLRPRAVSSPRYLLPLLAVATGYFFRCSFFARLLFGEARGGSGLLVGWSGPEPVSCHRQRARAHWAFEHVLRASRSPQRLQGRPALLNRHFYPPAPSGVGGRRCGAAAAEPRAA